MRWLRRAIAKWLIREIDAELARLMVFNRSALKRAQEQEFVSGLDTAFKAFPRSRSRLKEGLLR